MIANGEKTIEFRTYFPNMKPGKEVEVWVVATGNAQKPRRVICKVWITQFLDSHSLKTKHDLHKIRSWGYNDLDVTVGWQVEVIEKCDILLSDLGVYTTPQKYKWIEVENGTH